MFSLQILYKKKHELSILFSTSVSGILQDFSGLTSHDDWYESAYGNAWIMKMNVSRFPPSGMLCRPWQARCLNFKQMTSRYVPQVCPVSSKLLYDTFCKYASVQADGSVIWSASTPQCKQIVRWYALQICLNSHTWIVWEITCHSDRECFIYSMTLNAPNKSKSHALLIAIPTLTSYS